MKKYIVFDLDWTLIQSQEWLWEIVYNGLKEKYDFTREEYNYYFWSTQWTWLAIQLQNFLNIPLEEAKKEASRLYDLINEWTEKWKFFPWVPEKILELQKIYKLKMFLSTWNSTKFAEENLKKWWIYECFDSILWSDEVTKWSEHIKIFKEISMDSDFEKSAFYVWDWARDREIAIENSIDFIHIDENLENKFWDKYEIKSVAEISNILNYNL